MPTKLIPFLLLLSCSNNDPIGTPLGNPNLNPDLSPDLQVPAPSGCVWISQTPKVLGCRGPFSAGLAQCPGGYSLACPPLPSSLKQICGSDLGGFFAFANSGLIGHIAGDPASQVRCQSGDDWGAVTGCGTTSNGSATLNIFGGSCNGYVRAVPCVVGPNGWSCPVVGPFSRAANPNPSDGVLCCG